jgi:hypothetical protein
MKTQQDNSEKYSTLGCNGTGTSLKPSLKTRGISFKISINHPGAEVQSLVKFALRVVKSEWAGTSSGMANLNSGIQFRVQNLGRGARSGRAWYSRNDVLIKVGKAEAFPAVTKYVLYCHRPEFPEFNLENWQEALVYVAAYEINHIAAQDGRLRKQVSKLSNELQCERLGLLALQKYRQSQGKSPAKVLYRVTSREAVFKQGASIGSDLNPARDRSQKSSPAEDIAVQRIVKAQNTYKATTN